jgi:hypothetical protein
MSGTRPGTGSSGHTLTAAERGTGEDYSSEKPHDPATNPPDGGFQAWCVVAGV